jgi:hypothetical protein
VVQAKRVVGVATLTLLLPFFDGGSALAAAVTQSTVAVRECAATNVNVEAADVPETKQFDHFTSIPTNDGRIEKILCGDGRTWGAVHIELKHKVANWDITEECLKNTVSMGELTSEDEKRTWLFQWSPGHNALLVSDVRGVSSSHPWDGGSEESWEECASQ